VALIGGWHGAHHARLLAEIANTLPKLAKMRLPRLRFDNRGDGASVPAAH
jgi:hypothetical protein